MEECSTGGARGSDSADLRPSSEASWRRGEPGQRPRPSSKPPAGVAGSDRDPRLSARGLRGVMDETRRRQAPVLRVSETGDVGARASVPPSLAVAASPVSPRSPEPWRRRPRLACSGHPRAGGGGRADHWLCRGWEPPRPGANLPAPPRRGGRPFSPDDYPTLPLSAESELLRRGRLEGVTSRSLLFRPETNHCRDIEEEYGRQGRSRWGRAGQASGNQG